MNPPDNASNQTALPSANSNKYVEKFAELFTLTKKKFVIQNGKLWTVYNSIAVPYGPACEDYSISKDEAKAILRKLGTFLIRWGNGFNNVSSGEWFALTCDKKNSELTIPQNFKRQIAKAVKYCRVEKVSAEIIAKHGYETYQKSFGRYKNLTCPIFNQKRFYQEHIVNKNFESIIHYWAVFIGKKICAFSQNYIFDRTECAYHIVHCDPDFLFLHISEALWENQNEHYLKGIQPFLYVNAGLRNILHKTNIQNYLIKKFNFKPSPIGLSIQYQPHLQCVINLTYPYKNIFEKINHKLSALYKLETFRRADQALFDKAKFIFP